ncbi:MAG: uracil-DNA glycosylase [Planctomycetota bacterium]|jgi:DNA polymerase
MSQETVNVHKILKQHLEMERFFAGDFALKGQIDLTEPAPIQPQSAAGETDMPKTLQAIAKKVQTCTQCELSSSRTNAVPGQGNPKAKLVFVGEAPGADEDQQGLAFVGRAGKLLGEIIKAMGLSRDDVFICNILKCRPPGNRDPKLEEIDNCWPYLKRQLEILQPEVIVALGAHAARTLLHSKEAIGKLRGRFHEYNFSDEVPPSKLMPTYHPAYLLRNYSVDNRKRVWEDMQKVLKELGLPIPKKK